MDRTRERTGGQLRALGAAEFDPHKHARTLRAGCTPLAHTPRDSLEPCKERSRARVTQPIVVVETHTRERAELSFGERAAQRRTGSSRVS